MNKIIRWPGLIAFVLIMALIAGGVWLFANSMVKSLIESQGTSMAGARVDVGSVSLSLIPAGIVVNQLDVTDADKPMQNVISIASISARFDLLKAFMGQLIIYDASVNGMQFGTARKTSGAVEKKPPPPPKEPSFVSQQFAALKNELPDTSELLAREPLLVDERKNTLETSYEEKQTVWKQLEAQLPDSDKLATYESRLKAITETDIKSVADFQRLENDLKQLKREIQADQDLLKKARDHVQYSGKELTAQLKQLKDAPGEDRDRIIGKYTFDEAGLVNMSGLLFGDEIRSYLETALYWYERVSPYLASDDKADAVKRERAKGRFVRFEEHTPRPDFLIEKMGVSAILPAGGISAQLRDVTHQQAVINRPTTLHVMSEVLRDLKRLDVNAVFDYRKKDGHSTADFLLDDLAIRDFRISGGNDFPLALKTANSDMKGQLRLEDGRISGKLHGDFTDAQFQTAANTGMLRLLSQAFNDIQQFDMDVSVGGSLRNPDISVRSDIDGKLKNSLEKQVKAEIAAFRKELENKLAARLDGYLKDIDIDGFADDERDLNDKIAGLDNLLKAKLDDYKDQQKQEAKDKAKEKLKKLF